MDLHGCREGFSSWWNNGDCPAEADLSCCCCHPSGKSVTRHRVYSSLYKKASHLHKVLTFGIAEMFAQGNGTKTWIVFRGFSLPVVAVTVARGHFNPPWQCCKTRTRAKRSLCIHPWTATKETGRRSPTFATWGRCFVLIWWLLHLCFMMQCASSKLLVPPPKTKQSITHQEKGIPILK